MTYRLQRDKGRWGIYAVATRLEDGGEFTMNYEKIAKMEPGHGERIPSNDGRYRTSEPTWFGRPAIRLTSTNRSFSIFPSTSPNVLKTEKTA